MFKKNLYPFLAVLILAALFQPGCQRQPDVETPSPGTPGVEPEELVTASLTGRVTDEKGLHVEGATITTSQGGTVTDIWGRFVLKNTRLDKKYGYVRVEKPGYFSGSRMFSVLPGADCHVQIELIPKKIAGTFNAAAGGIVSVGPASIRFPSGAIVQKGTATAYQGTVSVAAYYFNPQAANFTATMPGALVGINAGGQEVGLQSFGMMAVELLGAGGEKLQLASGKKAVLDFPVPDALKSQAEATIPLWYFNETRGVWTEEGSATLQGGRYIGAVSHFSFWNVDKPYPLVSVEGYIREESGKPQKYALVMIRMVTDTLTVTGFGFTDSTGKFSGRVPKDKPLVLQMNNPCNETTFRKDIGPLRENTSLGNITAPPMPGRQVRITGSIFNCAGQPVTTGTVHISYITGTGFTRIQSSPSTTNNFTTNGTTTCLREGAEALVTAYDYATNTQSATIRVPLQDGNIQPVRLTVCETPEQYISFTLSGFNKFIFRTSVDSILYRRTASETTVSLGHTFWQREQFALSFSPSATGKPSVSSLRLMPDINQLMPGQNRVYRNEGPMNLTITQYGSNVNDYVSGSFSGTMRDSASGKTESLTGTFRVRRSH